MEEGGHRAEGCQGSREMLHWEMEQEKGYMSTGLGREVENGSSCKYSSRMSRLLPHAAGYKLLCSYGPSQY